MTKATQKPRTRRGNREGTYIQLPTGKWRAAVAWTDPDGRQHRRWATRASKAECIAWVTELRTSLDKGHAPTTGPSLTVARYLTDWLARQEQRVRPGTFIGYRRLVTADIIPAIGSVSLIRLTPSRVEAMTAAIVAKGHASTADSARRVLRAALNDALRDGILAKNVAALARAPRFTRERIVVLDVVQTGRLLAVSEADPYGPLWVLLASTGIRSGEALGLCWSRVDLANRRVVIDQTLARGPDGRYRLGQPTKSLASRRVLELPAIAVAALKRQRLRVDALKAAAGDQWQDTDLVFTTATGGNARNGRLGDRLHDACDRAGVPRINVHALRHGVATALVRDGMSFTDVAAQIGHSSPALVASTYSHAVADARREAATTMDRLLSGASR
jgi:integrase